ncbi:phage tail-collar fiber domain-containing protein [Xenorhabdus stockiae]|uniref:phage tail-collar fiber domain-containing protein n=1 Tax=Xenorhabdus stockiae TaxID=351614 RepID=UPI0040643178
MSTKYFALLTQLGADKLANAAALGTKIEITHMAVGDGGGSLPVPDTKQTKLINEKRRAAINTLSIDPKNTNQIIAEQVIPEAEGGWWIREIGLYDKDGVLVAVGNCAETYKPQLQEGSGRTQTIRMILIVSSANAVTLKVDPSIVLATREYVDNSITKHANSRNHPDATLKEKGFVILSSAIDSNSETHAATPKAVKAAYDLANAANNNANTRLEKNKNGADVADKDAFNRNIGSARAFNGSIHIGGGGTWTTEEFIAWLKSQGAFNHPYWMCKGTWWYDNNKRITDTGCGSIHLAGAVVEVMGIEGVMTLRVTTAPTSIDGCTPNAQFTYGNHGKDYYPSWRRDYNTTNKPTSGEVGAYSKEETDARVNAAHENANSRLEKNKNGADIPNKDEFVKNLGLTETQKLAAGALPKSGGHISGTVVITNDSEIQFSRNSDWGLLGFKNTGDGDADSFMYFETGDNGNEYFKWRHRISGQNTAEDWMSLKRDNLRIKGHPVYHEGNKPTAGEIGAVSASGGAYNQSFDFQSINVENFHIKYDKGKHNYISWFEDTKRSAYLGFPNDSATHFNIANEKLNSILTLHADSVTHNSRKLAFQDENYTKSESDNRFIRLNTNTKTSGYILSKAANLYDDPSSRDLGRSGFLRPNEGLDKLGALAIHVAHPLVEGAQHARGISFDYGFNTGSFGVSTYAFDNNGNFKGSKKILTEDDKDSLGSAPIGVPLPWPQANPPSGYLVCNGQSFNKATYPKLGLAYPSGKLPDLRGEFIRGLDAGRNVDSGRNVLSLQNQQVQYHAHVGGHGGRAQGAFGVTNQAGHPGSYHDDSKQTLPFTNNGSDYQGFSNHGAIGNETRPRNIAFLYIVRAA